MSIGLGLALGINRASITWRRAQKFFLSAADNTLSVRGFVGAPEAKFTSGMSPKYVCSASGILARQNYLFRTQTRTSSIALPDAQGGDPGEGFTCTGLAWDGAAFWIGNDGGNVEGDASRRPSVVRVSPAGEKLAEIDIGTLYTNNCSVQGVAVDADGSLWVGAAISSQVYHVSATGTNLGDGFGLSGINGVAYDSKRDCLWTLTGTTVARRDKAGTLFTSFTSPALSDQLFYDADRDYIWVTYGANGSTGGAKAYNADTLAEVGTALFTDATAMEGLVIVDGNFYIAHDGYYHAAAGAIRHVNEIQVYPAVLGKANVAWALDHAPISPHEVMGYLIEPAFTRLSDFPVAFESWAAPVNGVISTNTTVAPDGGTAADTLTASAATGAVYTSEAYTAATGACVQAIYAQKGTHPYVWIGDRGATGGVKSATFNLDTGSVVGQSASTVASIQAYENGWFLCEIEYTRASGGTSGLTLCLGTAAHTTDRPSATWAGTESIHIWAGQGANAPYVGSPVISSSSGGEVRAADAVSLPTSEWDFGTIVNTFVAEGWTARGGGVSQVLFQVDDGTEDNRYRVYRDSSNHVRFVVTAGGVEQCNLDLGTVANLTHFKVAARAASGDFAASINGGAAVTDSSGILPVVTTLRSGAGMSGYQWGGHLTSLSIRPLADDNSHLAMASTL